MRMPKNTQTSVVGITTTKAKISGKKLMVMVEWTKELVSMLVSTPKHLNITVEREYYRQ